MIELEALEEKCNKRIDAQWEALSLYERAKLLELYEEIWGRE